MKTSSAGALSLFYKRCCKASTRVLTTIREHPTLQLPQALTGHQTWLANTGLAFVSSQAPRALTYSRYPHITFDPCNRVRCFTS
ncbi:hypothetical protein ElyMa_000633600 [Elysia marginata]|uniref:Uncharacterized protein n=1 Tax=Elysia marginata TaxID=1093978 RepID=A0AAV4GE99_9GAST|nr:hypothetical protein ElyMa_000633600 [Elysia marginata]